MKLPSDETLIKAALIVIYSYLALYVLIPFVILGHLVYVVVVSNKKWKWDIKKVFLKTLLINLSDLHLPKVVNCMVPIGLLCM